MSAVVAIESLEVHYSVDRSGLGTLAAESHFALYASFLRHLFRTSEPVSTKPFRGKSSAERVLLNRFQAVFKPF